MASGGSRRTPSSTPLVLSLCIFLSSLSSHLRIALSTSNAASADVNGTPVVNLVRGILPGQSLPDLERINFKDSALNRLCQRPLCFEELREKYLAVINRVVPENRDVVLLGVREEDQFGDAIAWLGEILGVFHSLVHLAAQCFESDDTCAEAAIKMLPKDGLVLFHGNTGLRGQPGSRMITQPRARQMKMAMGHRVVFLPQPLSYSGEGDAKEDLATLQSIHHNDTHLLVISEADQGYATENFPGVFSSVQLIPSSAVNVGHMQLTSNRSHPADVEVMYWRQEEGTHKPAWQGFLDQLKHCSVREVAFTDGPHVSPVHDPMKPLTSLATMQLALQRAAAHGRRLIGAKIVITSDLDAVLFCNLLDVPVISVDETSTRLVEAMATIYGASERCGLGLRHFTADTAANAAGIAKIMLKAEKSKHAH